VQESGRENQRIERTTTDMHVTKSQMCVVVRACACACVCVRVRVCVCVNVCEKKRERERERECTLEHIHKTPQKGQLDPEFKPQTFNGGGVCVRERQTEGGRGDKIHEHHPLEHNTSKLTLITHKHAWMDGSIDSWLG